MSVRIMTPDEWRTWLDGFLERGGRMGPDFNYDEALAKHRERYERWQAQQTARSTLQERDAE